MTIRTQPTQTVELGGRAIGLVMSVVVMALLGLGRPVMAQEGGNQAGLVVQFSDGSLHTVCVDLGPSGRATGEEVLRASGYDALIDYGSGFGGGTVCKIGGEGCDFPAEKCFCECTMKPGDPCIYWSYFHLLDGQWRYSVQGVSRQVVGPGDVEAWVWGAGSASVGVAPPPITFEQICGPLPQMTVPPQVATSPEVTQQPTATEHLPTTDVSLAVTPVVSPQPTATVTEKVTFSPTPSTASEPEATMAPARTATPEAVAAVTQGEPRTPTDNEQSFAALSVQDSAGVPDKTVSYLVFGLLAVALAGGLIVYRVRQR
jgi:hypothetical protein